MGEYLYKDEGYKIIGCCYEVYNTLKPGLLEAIYKLSLCVEFERQSVPYETEKALKVYYKGVLLPKTYFADIVCYGDVIIEAKAVSTLTADHMAQLLNKLYAHHQYQGWLPRQLWQQRANGVEESGAMNLFKKICTDLCGFVVNET